MRILTDDEDREYHHALKDAAYTLAILALQSNRYKDDLEFRDAVDNVLLIVLKGRRSKL
jgi:hypothetical protein